MRWWNCWRLLFPRRTWLSFKSKVSTQWWLLSRLFLYSIFDDLTSFTDNNFGDAGMMALLETLSNFSSFSTFSILGETLQVYTSPTSSNNRSNINWRVHSDYVSSTKGEKKDTLLYDSRWACSITARWYFWYVHAAAFDLSLKSIELICEHLQYHLDLLVVYFESMIHRTVDAVFFEQLKYRCQVLTRFGQRRFIYCQFSLASVKTISVDLTTYW